MTESQAIGTMALMKADGHAQEIKRLYRVVADPGTSDADGVQASVDLVKHGVALAICFDAMIAAGLSHARDGRDAPIAPVKSDGGAN